jgi:hypothetical protein
MNTTHKILFGILISAMLWSVGCNKLNRIDGNNQLITENRQLVSFNRVVNEGTFNVYVKQDTIFEVTVEAESNLVPHIRTLVSGNSLVIDTRENLHNYFPMNVYVRTPFINGVHLKGSGYMQLDSLDTDNLEIELSGSGNIKGQTSTNYIKATISGSGSIDLYAVSSATDTKISGSGDIKLVGESFSGTHTISGSGSIRASNFLQNEIIAKISGSGNMYLNVSDKLDVTISGSGSVYYIGNPQLTINKTGSGSVIKQ